MTLAAPASAATPCRGTLHTRGRPLLPGGRWRTARTRQLRSGLARWVAVAVLHCDARAGGRCVANLARYGALIALRRRPRSRPYPVAVLHAQIREAVRDHLTDLHGSVPHTRLKNEMALCLGATRVDVAAVNGQLTGCEIKGARDSLARLPHQVGLYGEVLDVAVFVAEPRFAAKASDHVPDWWGVWEVNEQNERAVVTELRPAGENPSVNPLAVAQLLWRDEALEELVARGAARGLARATRWRLWEALVELLPLDELAEVVRAKLKARPEW